MTTHNQRIEHMLGCIGKIQEIAAVHSREDFLKTPVLQDAALYNFAILGEAAARLSPAQKEAHPDIPWSEMIGMRNVLVHDYVKTDFNFVWTTIERDLPALRAQLIQLLD